MADVSPATLLQAVASGLASGVFYAFLTLSFAVILALTRAFNLAHGDLVVLGGYVGYALGRVLALPVPLLVPLAALALLPVGLLWRALLGRIREPVELNSLVLTFGLSLLLQNLMLATWSADYRLLPGYGGMPGSPGPFGLPPGRAIAAGAGLVTIGLLRLALTHTRWGTALRATSRDAGAAALMGVNTDRVSLASFGAAAAIAGAGGVLLGTFHYLHPAAGVELTLLAITLAILGGIGRLGGLLVAGVAVGLAESLTVAWAGPSWRELVVAVFLLGALLGRARGLGTGHEHA